MILLVAPGLAASAGAQPPPETPDPPPVAAASAEPPAEPVVVPPAAPGMEEAPAEATAEPAAAAAAPSVTTPAPEPVEAAAAKNEIRAEPQVIEDMVDQALRLADLPASGNTPTHFAVAAAFLLLALLLRKTVARAGFALLRRIARRTPYEFDDYLLPALERTLRTLILLMGIVGALMVLKLPPAWEAGLKILYVVVFSFVALLFALRVADALLDHLKKKARRRKLNVVAFMPWIKRIVLAVIFTVGVLAIAQSLGANVSAFLAGLGIGGLAVALAAQDTLANIFGSVVIAVDQPFRVGEFVQIGAHLGAVEDIGLRSTRLRTPQRNLIVIPNKTVAAEPIINLTRFIQRRVEQNLGLTYDAAPDQLEALVEDLRALILAEPEVDATSVIVQFTEFTPSSLNLWLAYNTHDPDFVRHLKLKQRLNLAIMRAVARRGLRFAFPTQTVHVERWPGPPDRTAPDGAAG